MLRKGFFTAEQVESIVTDYHQAGLTDAEVAMMDFAQKLAQEAQTVTAGDVAGLRSRGFSDEEVLDIALAAAARCFFSKALDALGAEPDQQYMSLEPSLRKALAVGRPFESRA